MSSNCSSLPPNFDYSQLNDRKYKAHDFECHIHSCFMIEDFIDLSKGAFAFELNDLISVGDVVVEGRGVGPVFRVKVESETAGRLFLLTGSDEVNLFIIRYFTKFVGCELIFIQPQDSVWRCRVEKEG